jgi:hypothetical protein
VTHETVPWPAIARAEVELGRPASLRLFPAGYTHPHLPGSSACTQYAPRQRRVAITMLAAALLTPRPPPDAAATQTGRADPTDSQRDR